MSFDEIISTLEQFEYSSDGFPKRYPSKEEFDLVLVSIKFWKQADQRNMEVINKLQEQ